MSRTRTGEVKLTFATNHVCLRKCHDLTANHSLIRLVSPLAQHFCAALWRIGKRLRQPFINHVATQDRSFWTCHQTCATIRLPCNERGELMSLQTHLAELERKHRSLDSEIATELQHANTDSAKLLGLKRQKLKLKDAITKLRHEMESKTIH
ncbi:MAG: YdcH family protein [Beijerinckiaceae bacterium]